MAPPQLVPDKTTLRRWQKEGLTQKQMADRHEAESGIRVSRAAIAAAMVRYGLSETKPRYTETLPWHVSMDHITEYPARMLRLLGRRRAGGTLNDNENERLDSWLDMLKRERVIVAYAPDSTPGFHYIDQQYQDGPKAIPIRREPIHLNVPMVL